MTKNVDRKAEKKGDVKKLWKGRTWQTEEQRERERGENMTKVKGMPRETEKRRKILKK